MPSNPLQPGLNRIPTGVDLRSRSATRSIAFLLFGKYPNRLSAWNSAGWPTLSPLLAKRGEVRVALLFGAACCQRTAFRTGWADPDSMYYIVICSRSQAKPRANGKRELRYEIRATF